MIKFEDVLMRLAESKEYADSTYYRYTLEPVGLDIYPKLRATIGDAAATRVRKCTERAYEEMCEAFQVKHSYDLILHVSPENAAVGKIQFDGRRVYHNELTDEFMSFIVASGVMTPDSPVWNINRINIHSFESLKRRAARPQSKGFFNCC